MLLSRTESGSMATPHPSSIAGSDAEGKPSFFRHASNKVSTYHAQTPYLRRLPFPVIAIIITLITVNLLVWAAVAIVLVCKEVEFKSCNSDILMVCSIGIQL